MNPWARGGKTSALHFGPPVIAVRRRSCGPVIMPNRAWRAEQSRKRTGMVAGRIRWEDQYRPGEECDFCQPVARNTRRRHKVPSWRPARAAFLEKLCPPSVGNFCDGHEPFRTGSGTAAGHRRQPDRASVRDTSARSIDLIVRAARHYRGTQHAVSWLGEGVWHCFQLLRFPGKVPPVPEQAQDTEPKCRATGP